MKIYLAIATLANIALGIYGFVPAMMSPMLFDAPGSAENPLRWILLFVVWVFPFVAFLSALMPWLYWHKRNRRAAVMASSGAVAWVLLLVLPIYLLAFLFE